MSKSRICVLFVCLGNICRSPLAEGVFREKVEEAGLEAHFEIDSAGTGGWHVGEPPDKRMSATAKRRGVDLTALRARQLTREDLSSFHHILVMDREDLANTRRLDPAGEYATRIALFRSFDTVPEDLQVPDPYYGGPEGFDRVFEIVERTAEALLAHLRKAHGL